MIKRFIFLTMVYLPFIMAYDTLNDVIPILDKIHSNLQFKHGSLKEEYPEQLMTAKFLSSDAVVLELGGNIGRNSCVIASLLTDSSHFVTMEPNEFTAALLKENRDLNGFQFHIEASAISKIPLCIVDWKTSPYDEAMLDSKKIKTITFQELQNKYDLQFDTLIVDCEGALYHILNEEQNFLNNINMIITENDYTDINQFYFVESVFKLNGFRLAYNQQGGWDPCFNFFYQVWIKNNDSSEVQSIP